MNRTHGSAVEGKKKSDSICLGCEMYSVQEVKRARRYVEQTRDVFVMFGYYCTAIYFKVLYFFMVLVASQRDSVFIRRHPEDRSRPCEIGLSLGFISRETSVNKHRPGLRCRRLIFYQIT